MSLLVQPQDEDKASLYSLEIDEAYNPSIDETKPLYPDQAQHLNAPHAPGILRIPSPNAFAEPDVEGERTGRSTTLRPPGQRLASRSPAPVRGVKGRVNAFWVRNKGLALVLLAQVFGTLMNVTTRILELEGNNGKGLHPFQVSAAAGRAKGYLD
jgi:hypothetical protein